MSREEPRKIYILFLTMIQFQSGRYISFVDSDRENFRNKCIFSQHCFNNNILNQSNSFYNRNYGVTKSTYFNVMFFGRK